ncbi:uncharacterized protein LOC126251315 isoform X1 [Schistocerca nitens]|uniref:uncharacterized protein LOC126251315 isoform X1 n=2 Tax=Schistocerca nitens TaxID=7011 RepID=UPI0021181100|nr:uncharacterized protein LOC126251315 isoform X1 [Schistocerca nitens]
MHPGGVAASLLVFLAANDTVLFDCVCKHILGDLNQRRLSPGETQMSWTYCMQVYRNVYALLETCETLKPPSVALPAVAQLAAIGAGHDLPLPAEQEEKCSAALEEIRGLTVIQAWQLLSKDLHCRLAAVCIDSCPLHGLDEMEWNLETLTTDHLRHPILSQLVHAVRRITVAIIIGKNCYLQHTHNYPQLSLKESEFQNGTTAYLEQLSNDWRNAAQLLSIGVSHLSQLFVPLAFEHMANHTSNQRLHVWIKNMERVRDMLHTKLKGLVRDMQSVSENIANYTVEVDKDRPGNYVLRRPLLNEGLLDYHEQYLSFRGEFSALCKEQEPNTSQMFALADAMYSFYRAYWFNSLQYLSSAEIRIIDEEWQLEDKSNATLSVDTDCMQLLADVLDHPTCPLEDLPPETIKRREQCRVQLWTDMMRRSPHIPVTSYLAYTQRTNVNLCLLAWMAVNSFGICQDVPFSIMQSVQDARCYFDNLHDQSCLESNATDAICSVSRAIVLLKCRDFSFRKPFDLCRVVLFADGSYSPVSNSKWFDRPKGYLKPTERTLNFKDSLNNATLKYKDFKIESLQPLENWFIAVNILFRFLTAGIYMYLPHLRNLPGMIFLLFQVTGVIQILCSEVMYRMVGVPDLPTTVLIDSALTLLSCIWLSAFCYQMYACIRHLRLPNDLLPAEARKVFCRQVLYALIPWSLVCAASITLEKTNKDYIFHSRIIILAGISLSISSNLVLLGLVGFMYLRNKKSMRQLEIFSKNKLCSKKQLLYLSVKTVMLSGICILIRIGFHQAQGVAQFVYYVHIASMAQGPLLFVFFICNDTTLPVFKRRMLALWRPDVVSPGEELCSSAERNLAKRNNEQAPAAESSLNCP